MLAAFWKILMVLLVSLGGATQRSSCKMSGNRIIGHLQSRVHLGIVILPTLPQQLPRRQALPFAQTPWRVGVNRGEERCRQKYECVLERTIFLSKDERGGSQIGPLHPLPAAGGRPNRQLNRLTPRNELFFFLVRPRCSGGHTTLEGPRIAFGRLHKHADASQEVAHHLGPRTYLCSNCAHQNEPPSISPRTCTHAHKTTAAQTHHPHFLSTTPPEKKFS